MQATLNRSSATEHESEPDRRMHRRTSAAPGGGTRRRPPCRATPRVGCGNEVRDGVRDARRAAPGPAARRGYPRGVPDPIILGYDPATLRERIDVDAAEARLTEVLAFRSLAAMNEQVALLRMLGRLDEAFDIAQAAYRQSRFTGAREDALAARIRRAQVQQYQGKLDVALTELSGCVDEAITHEWHEHAGFALQHRGKTRFDLGDYAGALADFERALEERERDGIPQNQVESTKFAIRATKAILDGTDAPDPGEHDRPAGIPTLDA